MSRAWIVVFCIALAIPASAQRNVDVERFRPAVDSGGFVGLQGTKTPGAWRLNAGLVLNYSRRPLVGRTATGEVDLVRHRLLGDLFVQLGLGDRGAIAVDLPVVLHQSAYGTRLGDGLGAIPRQAFGDLRVMGRARVYGAAGTDRADGPAIALLAALTLPTGTDNAFTSEDQPTFDLQATADFHILGLGAGLMLGWRHRFDDRMIGETVFRDQLLFGIGIKVPIPLVAGLGARVEVRGALDARRPFSGGARSAIEGNFGLTFESAGTQYMLGVGTGFSSGVGSPSVRAIFGVSWQPRTADLDGDGIGDDVDECPHLPEDFDDFQDEDGCMDPDNDNDFVPDVDDRCPLEEALEGQDEDEDGCTDPARPEPEPEPQTADGEEPQIDAEQPSEDSADDSAPANRVPAEDAQTEASEASRALRNSLNRPRPVGIPRQGIVPPVQGNTPGDDPAEPPPE